MTAKSLRAFRGTAVTFFAIGLLFLLTDKSGLGLSFLVIGFAFMARSTKEGSSYAQKRPLVFALVLIILIVITVIIAAALLLPKFL